MTEERGFRRVFHASGSMFVGYYLLPEEPLYVRQTAVLVGAVILAVATVIEMARLAGWLPKKDLYGLREYETRRPASYLYWGLGALPLFLLVPEQIVVPCVLASAIGDPVVGEARMAVGAGPAAAVGLAVGAAFFVLAGLPPAFALGAGTAFVAAESFKNPWLDDDLLTLVVPAALLVALAHLGLLTPVDIVTPMPPLGGL